MAYEPLTYCQMPTIRGTKEWAVAEINCSFGCPYNCRYCYARTAALKHGLIDSPDQWTQSQVLVEEVTRIHPHYQGQVMFPTAHDLTDENLYAALTVINNLLAADNRVLIVSKPSLSCIETICRRFADQKQKIVFRFTITARNPQILSFWEPGAPAYQERLKALECSYRQGFSTSVSIEPVLDMSDLEGLVEELEPYVNHSIWIGKMNRIQQRVIIDSDQIAAEIKRIRKEQQDGEIEKMYQRLQHKPLIRWKESIKEIVGLPLSTQLGQDK